MKLLTSHPLLRSKILRWLSFGVFFSTIPLILVLFIYNTAGYEVQEMEYVPDLILVSFAVTVNCLGSVYGRKTKHIFFSDFCIILSIVSMVVCTALYFFLIGRAIGLNEQLAKFEAMTDQDPKLLYEVVNELKTYLDEKVNNVKWPSYIHISILILFISSVFGIIIEVLQFKCKKINPLTTQLQRLLDKKRIELDEKSYRDLELEIEQFLEKKT